MIAVEESVMNALLRRCGESSAGIILRLAWQAGLNRPEMHALTWDQVDLDRGELHLPTHTVPLAAELLAALRQRYAAPFRRLLPPPHRRAKHP